MGKTLHRDITIRGVTYATVQAAARALGVHENTVRQAAKLGRLDGVGLGESHPVPLPVRIGGVVYPTVRQAAQALGVRRATIYAALAVGRADRVIAPRTAAVDAAPVPPKPIRIGAMSFASMNAADRALGLTPGTVSQVLRRRKSPRAWQRVLAAAMRVQAETEARARAERLGQRRVA